MTRVSGILGQCALVALGDFVGAENLIWSLQDCYSALIEYGMYLKG